MQNTREYVKQLGGIIVNLQTCGFFSCERLFKPIYQRKVFIKLALRCNIAQTNFILIANFTTFNSNPEIKNVWYLVHSTPFPIKSYKSLWHLIIYDFSGAYIKDWSKYQAMERDLRDQVVLGHRVVERVKELLELEDTGMRLSKSFQSSSNKSLNGNV